MSLKRVIPITPLMRRYQALRAMPQADRLVQAEHLVAHPHELAAEFATSVAHFAPYENVREPFYPPERAQRTYAEEVKRTNDLVLRLAAQGPLTPVDGPRFAMDYVDRELLVHRTTSPAAWEDGSPNRGGVRLDILLADAADRTPIVGELKLPGDMDPFFALIQALACAAHLATPNQYERMRRHLHRGRFPVLDGPPRLDVAVLFAGSGEPPRGRFMPALHAAAETLALRLMAEEALATHVRRIFGLSLVLDDAGAVQATVRWA